MILTTKAEFDAQQWQTITEGPALAGLIVVSAQRGGTIRESVAMAKVYAEAKKTHAGQDLLGEIAEKPPHLATKEFSSLEDLRTVGMERIRNAVTILEPKATPEEVESYKQFCLTVGERAAEADKSGGFLGVGGERVTDSESAALDELASTLGVERAAGSSSPSTAEQPPAQQE